MKTNVIVISIVVLMLSAIITTAQQNNKLDSSLVSNKKGAYYIDKNKDGVCDNLQLSNSNQKGQNYVNETFQTKPHWAV